MSWEAAEHERHPGKHPNTIGIKRSQRRQVAEDRTERSLCSGWDIGTIAGPPGALVYVQKLRDALLEKSCQKCQRMIISIYEKLDLALREINE